MSTKIYLSPSNQDANIYAAGNTNEMIQCNKIAEAAKKYLEKHGFEVKKAAQGQNMWTSINESNSWGANLHVPIHTNAFNGSLTGGTLIMIYSTSGENLKAGHAIFNRLAPITPGSDYSIRRNTSLAELNSTKAIAVYIECEFHDTVDGANFIINNTDKLGEAIAHGICDYFGVKWNDEDDNTSDTFYRVQVGAFSQKENAEKQLDKLKNEGYDAFITEVDK
ncbi:MAG: N-acetylmuramoyl-L-alanine amidase [Anaeromassilibacillus sp.]|nr:N-acetylmuramoyl-L-alanine amidase [Anaeromassilibacillus sp.]MDY3780456.1 N-acetylmuramoyl-L-alanine amidase [Candidatus Limousia pullorum]